MDAGNAVVADDACVGAPERGPASAEKREPNPVALLLAWSEENRGRYALSVLLAVIGVAGSIVPYVAAGQMIVGVLGGVRDFGFYLMWCGVAAAGYAGYIVCHHASTAVSHKATFSTISKVRRRIADKLTRVPLGYVLDTPSGKLKNIMVEKVDSIETTLAHVVPEMTSNLLVPVAVVAFMFALDWRMALVALVTLPIGFVAYMGMMKDYDRWYAKTVQAGEDMSTTAVEYVNGIEVIKAFGRSASSYEKFSETVGRYARSFIDWMRHVQIFQDLGLAIWPATLVTVLPVGCLFILQGTLEPATLVMVAVLSLSIFPPLYAAMSFIDSLAQIGTVVEQITAILDEPEQRRASASVGAEALAQPRGTRIELEGVRFSYGREEVVHGVDLAIEPGQVTALVGPSGSGKSTLARLIAGFWDADAGTVRLGGVPVGELSAEQLAGFISYVEQDNYLFDDTVMRRSSTATGRWWAARAATSRAASASASPSRAPCSRTRPWSCSTRPRRTPTPRTRRSSSRPWASWWRARRSSSSRTACPPSSMPTRSSSCATGASRPRARTTSSWPVARCTRACTAPTSTPKTRHRRLACSIPSRSTSRSEAASPDTSSAAWRGRC